jgi:hypothetical protein
VWPIMFLMIGPNINHNQVKYLAMCHDSLNIRNIISGLT